LLLSDLAQPGYLSVIRSDNFSYFPQECFDILLGWRDEQFASVLTDVLSEKVKAFLDVYDPGLLG
jgi:hypothetical protein